MKITSNGGGLSLFMRYCDICDLYLAARYLRNEELNKIKINTTCITVMRVASQSYDNRAGIGGGGVGPLDLMFVEKKQEVLQLVGQLVVQQIRKSDTNSAFHPSGVGRSSTGLPGWD